jgi:Tol biopolymer transport system component
MLGIAVLAAAVLLVPGTARPAFPGTNGKIAFATDRDGDFEIYTMNADGSGQTRLTTATGDDLYPVWSADGAKLAFSSQRTGFNSQIYTMTASGANQMPLTNTSPASNYEPAWSPTGTQIAFVSDRTDGIQLWKMNADGSNQVQLTDTVGFYNVDPVWSPDGTHIAFTSSRDGNEEIYVINADGSNPTRLTNDSGSDAGPAYSPDGTKIAFQTTRADGSRDVWSMNADGSNQVPLASGPAFDSSPAWSPDGTEILFQSNRDGDFEIFSMNADGSNQTALTNNTALDRLADWQPMTFLDTVAPVAKVSVGKFMASLTGNKVKWSATDAAPSSGGPFVFDVQRQSGTTSLGAFAPFVTGTTATQGTFSGVEGETDCFQARATDAAGNTGVFGKIACTGIPIDDAHATANGFTQQSGVAGYFQNTRSVSNGNVGSFLKTTSQSNVKVVGVVVDIQPGGATLSISMNGITACTVDTSNSTVKHKKAFACPAFSTAQTGRIVVTQTTAGPLTVDGIGKRLQ